MQQPVGIFGHRHHTAGTFVNQRPPFWPGAVPSSVSYTSGFTPSFFRRHAGLDIFFDVVFDVEAQFIVEFRFDGLAPRQCAQPNPQITEYRGPVARAFQPARFLLL